MLYQIAPNLYRSALPDTQSIALLKSLGIVTIVNLYQQSDSNWLPESSGIRQIHLPLRLGNMDDEDSLRVLRHIRAAQADGAVLLHCRHGQNRTGLVAALYRVVYQGWSKEEAMEEMRQGFGKRGMKHGIAYLQEVDIDALKQALNSGACSTHPLALCHLKDWLKSLADTRQN